MYLAQWIYPRQQEKQDRELSSESALPIVQQLERWRDDRVFIGVSLAGDERQYQSMVLAVDGDSGLFLLDAPFPAIDSQLLLRKVVQLEAFETYAKPSFSSICIGFGQEPESGGLDRRGQTLVMKVPTATSQNYRRDFFRVNLSQVQDASVHWTEPKLTTQALILPIENISTTGVAIRAPIEIAEQIKIIGKGTVLVSVLDRMFQTQVEVRHVLAEENQQAQIGCAFSNLTSDKLYKLEQWVMRLQRQVLQIGRQAA